MLVTRTLQHTNRSLGAARKRLFEVAGYLPTKP